MQVMINDTTNIYVVDGSPAGNDHFSARFYLNPNSINIPNDSGMYIFAADAAPNGWAFCLYLKYSGGSYNLSTCVSDDTNIWYYSSPVTLSNNWQAIEMEWQSASAPGANNGYLKMWINDVIVDTLSNLDTDTLGITSVTLGAVSTISPGISGLLYFDDFESRTVQKPDPK